MERERVGVGGGRLSRGRGGLCIDIEFGNPFWWAEKRVMSQLLC
jgi:hypothetical protein